MSKLTAEMSPGQHINKNKGRLFDAESPRLFFSWVSVILLPLPYCPISSLSNIYGARGQWNSCPPPFQAISNQNMKANATWRVLPYVIFSNLALQKLPRERFCGGTLLQQPDGTQPNNTGYGCTKSKQARSFCEWTCGGPGLSSPKLKLVAKNPNGKAPGGDFRKQALIITINDPEICLKSIHPHAHHSSHRYRRTCESPQAGLPQSRILKKHNLLKALKESTMLVKWFGGPENGLLVVGSALWPWGLGGTFSLCLQVVSSRNMVTIDNEHTQCSPGIFAIRITTAIQRNNFIFTNASLKQCNKNRNSGTKTFQEVHLAHRAYLSVRSGLQPLSWMFYTMWI